MIDDLLHQISIEGSGPELESSVTNAVSNGTVARHLADMLSSESKMNMIANRSFLHSNGFMRLVVASLGDRGARLRCHVWSESSSDTSVHDHAWNFGSVLIGGELTAEEWRMTGSAGSSKQMYGWKIGTLARPGTSSLGKIRLELATATTYVQGDSYSLQSDILHRIVNPSQYTTTLVLQAPHSKTSTIVYSPSPAVPQPYEVTRPPVETIKKSLEAVLRQLA